MAITPDELRLSRRQQAAQPINAGPVVPTDLAADPGALVGRKVRRSTRAAPRYTAWAQIVMTVPSRDGVCWLVTFIDGDVDVWRVDDPHARYQFDPQ
jgi:hypothetical protein